MNNVRAVKLSEIRANPVALRTSVDTEGEKYIQIRDSIGDPKIGLLNSITVTERSEKLESGEVVKFYEVVDGLHRYTAMCELGITDTTVTIKDYDETQVFLAQMIGNSAIVDTTPVQYTKHLVRLLGLNSTWTMADLATAVHRSPAWINGRLSLLKLSEDLQKLVEDGSIPLLNGIALSKLPAAEQVNYADQAMVMPNAEFGPLVQTRVEAIREAERAGRAAAPAGFVAAAVARKKTEIQAALSNVNSIAHLFSDAKSREEVAKIVLEWALQLDKPTVATKEAQFNENRARTEEAAKRRAQERADKRAEEAAVKAAKLREPATA